MIDVLKIASKLAKPFEGLSLKAYYDPVGYPTIGFGHLLSLKAFEFKTKTNTWNEALAALRLQYPDISLEQATILLEQDMIKAYKAVMFNVKYPLNNNQLAALTDFVFNVGPGNFRNSTLLKLINRGELQDAADQFLRWNKAGGIVLKGLTNRTIARRKLFLNSQ